MNEENITARHEGWVPGMVLLCTTKPSELWWPPALPGCAEHPHGEPVSPPGSQLRLSGAEFGQAGVVLTQNLGEMGAPLQHQQGGGSGGAAGPAPSPSGL